MNFYGKVHSGQSISAGWGSSVVTPFGAYGVNVNYTDYRDPKPGAEAWQYRVYPDGRVQVIGAPRETSVWIGHFLHGEWREVVLRRLGLDPRRFIRVKDGARLPIPKLFGTPAYGADTIESHLWTDSDNPSYQYRIFDNGEIYIAQSPRSYEVGVKIEGSRKEDVQRRYYLWTRAPKPSGTAHATPVAPVSSAPASSGGSLTSVLSAITSALPGAAGQAAPSAIQALDTTGRKGSTKEGLIDLAKVAAAYAPGAVSSVVKAQQLKHGDPAWLRAHYTKLIAKYHKTKSKSKRAKLLREIIATRDALRALGQHTPGTSAGPSLPPPKKGPNLLLIGGIGAGVILVAVLASRGSK